MSIIDEKTLVKKAAQGNAQAFEQLVLKYQGQIYNLCLRMTGNPEDGADMTQEAFLKAWKSLPGFHFEAAFSTWLYRLASNACLDFLRSTKRRPTLPLILSDEDGEDQVVEVVDDDPTPEEQVIRSEDREALTRAMEELDPEHRQILTLRVVNDLSYTAIAEILGVKEGTVKSRLSRARENLRKNLLQIGNKPAASSSNQRKARGC